MYGWPGGRELRALCVQGVLGVRPACREGAQSYPMCPRCARCTAGLEGGSSKLPNVSKVYEVYGWPGGRGGNVQRLCIWLCTKPIVAPNMFEIISPQLKVYQTPLFFSSACTILASIAICLPSIATFLPSIATFLPNIATPTKKLLLSRKFSYFRENHII